MQRRLPIGAEVDEAGVHFRVWAPIRKRVEVEIAGARHPLQREAGGYFSGFVRGAKGGATYRYRLDEGKSFPDPASRFQPDGPHGPSMVIDPRAFAWRDRGWRGVTLQGAVLYELHVGTFTREGTFAAAARELPRLAELGVTIVELMPVAEFPGAFGWGYDGVDLFAPCRAYGTPDDLRRLVDEAHALGLGVIADVVYNHCGPDGCYLRELAPAYFTKKYGNEWGEALNFDGDDAGPVRELFVSNAGYWIDELHFDGLRLDATQTIHDASPVHVVQEIARRAREAAKGRSIVIVGENETQTAKLARAVDRGGLGLDALWNDDYHHSAVVAATGQREAYYSDHLGAPQELVSALKRGFLFQGQRYAWQKKDRGSTALDLPARAFVHFLENHDQVANTARGTRLWQRTTPGRWRALVALTLLGPETPMLFQGEEFASSAPFLYFADHVPDLAAKVRAGRAEFIAQFPNVASDAMRSALDDPGARATFERCKLDPAERERNAHVVAMYRDLLALRRTVPAFSQQRADRIDGAVIGPEAFVVRFFCERGDRLLVVNLGASFTRGSIADPLVAAPRGGRWRALWSSEDPKYGGDGAGPVDGDDGWRIGGHQATVLGEVAQ